jgi:hypothetical protein
MHPNAELLTSLAHDRAKALRADADRHRLRSAVAKARTRFTQHRASGDPAG